MADAHDGAGDETYEVLSSATKFRGRVIELRVDDVRMSDGSVAQREIVGHPGAVGVVALDDDDRVVLVNQYRVPVGRRLDELPAGLLDVAGESAIDAARRELAEEAALAADTWHVLLDLYTSPGMTDEAIRVYLARGLRPAADDFTAEHEEITMTVAREPLDAAVSRVLSGDITNATAAAGILAAAYGRSTGWAQLREADAPWPARPGR
jgi:8-oxo-dGDP phosphatase